MKAVLAEDRREAPKPADEPAALTALQQLLARYAGLLDVLPLSKLLAGLVCLSCNGLGSQSRQLSKSCAMPCDCHVLGAAGLLVRCMHSGPGEYAEYGLVLADSRARQA